jgi:hypothetical protein
MRRTWSWLGAVVMGLLIGPGPIAAESEEVDPVEAERDELEEGGFAVRGIEFYVWDEDAEAAEEWALALAQSPSEQRRRAERWRAIAEQTAAMPRVPVRERELAFAARCSDTCEESGLTPLGVLLCLLPGLDRTYLVSSLATSPDEKTRLALARALAAPFDALGVDAAISQLAQDPSPDVARHARFAFSTRARG